MVAKRQKRLAAHPRNPWERDRLVKELMLLGTYGLRNKRELWTVLARARADKKKARTLLISTDYKEVMTQGRALLSRLCKNGMISSVDFNDEEDVKAKLREVLSFDLSRYLDRRLQSLVLKAGLARDIRHARLLVVHKHIVVKGNVTNKPSMVVRAENEGFIELNPSSSVTGYRKGRYMKKMAAGGDPQEE